MNLYDAEKELNERLGFVFNDLSLLKRALTHSSYANEHGRGKGEESSCDDYERLEFLGDAVLELSVSDHLYRTMPESREGDMTKLRASLVCEPTLSYCAKAFELDKYILLGKGEEQTGGRSRDSIISDVFEAVVGALYLDGGLDKAKEFIGEYVLKDMYNKIEFVDSKTILQEYVQERGLELSYELISESGPAHDREYLAAALIDGKEASRGSGRSKKSAEQAAAYEALKAFKRGLKE
ncbi:MAG: ribonuclease III [Lachnospiraceae bacterium]|nr:ribonuclease III [Lachnospiraceae bacterium]